MQQCVTTNNYDKLAKAMRLVNERKLDKDKFSRWLFTAYNKGDITRREYHDLFTELEKNLHNFCDSRELNNVLKRMDWRTLGEFALMIFDNTIREKILTDAWVEMCESSGLLGSAMLADNGMSNNGLIIFSLKFVNHDSDFIIKVEGSQLEEMPDGEHKLEVKYCPTDRFLTYKARDLESYVRQKSLVLTVMGENKMFGANGNPDVEDSFSVDDLKISGWSLMTPKAMSQMLHTLPVKRYEGYMGNKPSVRVYRDDSPNYRDYFVVRKWAS